MRHKRPGGSLQHVDLLRQAADGLTSRVEQILAEDGLTVDQWRVLSTLNDQGALSMSDLSARTRITGPTVTRAVDRLVERALLYRNVDPTDRRRVLVLPAERGKALCRSLGPPIAEAERAGLSALSAVEARTLRRLLERLAGS
jgi:MarR family transcriptional regulator, organic hydroperoxide resistance regulator